jgi:hypothetical protein
MAVRVAVALALAFAVAAGPLFTGGVGTSNPHGTGSVGLLAGPSGAAPGVAATVTWNGIAIDQAGSPGSAFPIGAGESATVRFNFTESAGSPSVTNASLDLLFLGVVLSTESIPAATVGLAGVAEMNWSFGALIYLTEGVYEVDAKLLDANGTALFVQPFYVDARAPFLLGSAILSMAIVLGIVEAFWIRSVVRFRRPRRGRYRFR